MPVPCSEIINDIEDLINAVDVEPKQRYSTRKHVKLRRPANIQNQLPSTQVPEPTEKDDDLGEVVKSVVPGTQAVYIKTWGCAHNNSDSEYMAGQLSAYGYKLTENPEEADLWLLNSCTVKGPAEDHFRNEVERGREMGKHVVTAGCVPQGAPRSSYLTGLSVIGVQNIDRVVEVVEETLKGHSVRLLGQKKSNGKKLGGANLELPKVRKNPFVEIIAISTGCLNQCTYCKTKHARGELGSYPPSAIVERAVQAFSDGVKEIWLTSEDTGAYGRDIGESLPGLLTRLVEIIPEGCMLRLGMTNPPYILEHLEAMALILNHPRVYKFLHVPVQSGSDQVLSDMKREYSSQEFQHVVDFLRKRVPGITIATDIICAFPTETEEYFEKTMDLCRKNLFPSLFVNQYYPRPGTPAARLPRVPAQEAKRRTRMLSQFFQTYEPYGDQLQKEMWVLVTEQAKDGAHYIGHNQFYHQIVIKKDTCGQDLMGKNVLVRVTETKKHCLLATPTQTLTPPTQQRHILVATTMGLSLLIALLVKLYLFLFL